MYDWNRILPEVFPVLMGHSGLLMPVLSLPVGPSGMQVSAVPCLECIGSHRTPGERCAALLLFKSHRP